jgi:hypothetical protein
MAPAPRAAVVDLGAAARQDHTTTMPRTPTTARHPFTAWAAVLLGLLGLAVLLPAACSPAGQRSTSIGGSAIAPGSTSETGRIEPAGPGGADLAPTEAGTETTGSRLVDAATGVADRTSDSSGRRGATGSSSAVGSDRSARPSLVAPMPEPPDATPADPPPTDPPQADPGADPPEAASTFTRRGVIEGAYATPSTHTERTDMLTWMAAHGMNTYVHAPKLDPYADFLWRTPYPSAAMADFAAEIDRADDLGIDWIPAIRPGSDLCFTCPEDRAALLAKLQPFVDAGAPAVMVSFDDVATQGTDADRAAYGEGPAARGFMTSDLLNAVKEALPRIDVMTVLSEYTGTTATPFYAAVSERLTRSIDVFWTGPGVVSPTITTADAQTIREVLRRKVIVWANYPVNDYSGAPGAERRLHLGPFKGLDPGLPSVVQGVLANVQSPWALNTVSLATLADYLDHPGGYDAEESWRAALAEVGGTDAAALTKLAENSRSSMIDPTESIVAGPLLDRVGSALAAGRRDRQAEQELRDELRAEIEAAAALRASDLDLAVDAARWIDVLEQNARAALAALDLAIATMPRIRLDVVGRSGQTRLVAGHVEAADLAAIDAARAVLSPIDTARRGAIAVTHGDRLGHPESVGPGNRIDQFVDTVLALPRPTSSAPPTVLVNGQPAEVDFRVAVPAGTSLDVLATDPSGARTHELLRWDT